jgi:hypothetical protein
VIIAQPVNSPDAWSARAEMPEPWTACGWSQDGQRDRHVAVIAALEPQQPGDRLLDWGCGTGELVDLVPSDVEYVGFDWAEGMVIRAGTAHPDRLFQGHQPSGVFDLVACVGCFNLPGGWSKQHTWHTIRHLWDTTACRTIAVSLYSGDDPSCLSYDGEEVARCGASLGFYTEVEQIRHNDLLLTVRR